jgi:hypothetical protein
MGMEKFVYTIQYPAADTKPTLYAGERVVSASGSVLAAQNWQGKKRAKLLLGLAMALLA